MLVRSTSMDTGFPARSKTFSSTVGVLSAPPTISFMRAGDRRLILRQDQVQEAPTHQLLLRIS